MAFKAWLWSPLTATLWQSMSNCATQSRIQPGAVHVFVTTHWGMVLLAGGTDSAEASAALEDLCRSYWYPLYVWVRRQGHSPEDAQDLTQEFFARMLGKNYLKFADPQRGRFRTFLLSSLRHFLVNEWQKDHALKRGGHRVFLPFDEEAPESRYLAEPMDGLAVDKLFDRRWALALLQRVVRRLEEEYAGAGKALLFDNLKAQALGEGVVDGYGVLAERMKMSEGALRVAAHRMRERYRELLRAEVSQTVSAPDEVDPELRHLIAVLRE